MTMQVYWAYVCIKISNFETQELKFVPVDQTVEMFFLHSNRYGYCILSHGHDTKLYPQVENVILLH